MSTDCFQTAYERAIDELAEINEQLQKLILRKELLEKLLEPLRLVAQSAPVATPKPLSVDSNAGFTSREEDAQVSTIILVDMPEAGTSPLETRVPFEEPEQPGVRAESNGRYFSDEEVAELAYRFWSESGRTHGRHEEDWLRAAQELQSSA